ncbi:helix-turn-helix transcriptional regulator [Hymenobacter armeniacus]|uniref:YafY family transcriptional regulator n=1 Tax=Hymenobacter armeniacus TaxID=2771358 RepID=A0ABR8JUN2_9BACT|nr:YafY family protein [Hymenobacter armeniacus]MBD2723660.1 YafY family transcriptional regulator [Hymenobacter armeniacus]
MNRFDRITAILLQLQAKRLVRGPGLAAQFGVSLRTVYRDLRTLEAAGVPLYGEAGVGYSLAEGYRLPPVMFTREEAAALLTAEKLAARLADAQTARHGQAAMDKLRAVLRRADRDYLEQLSPHIQVVRPGPTASAGSDVHQQLLAAIATQRVVRLQYRAGYPEACTERDAEPIGLYLGQYWHVVAYCRLRQAFRDFRLDRIEHLRLQEETFAPRAETLQQYWAQQAERRPRDTAVVRFGPEAARRAQDAKRQYGWAHEQPAPDGSVEMTFVPGYLPPLAAWLLPQAGAVTVVSPPELRQLLQDLARQAYQSFGSSSSTCGA